MKTKLSTILITSLLLSSNMLAQVASGGPFTLEKSVVAPGGSESTAGAFSLTGTIGQNAAGTNMTTLVFSQIGGFWTPEAFAPTAASVSIGGKIATFNGNGLRNVVVTLTDLNGSTRTKVTGSFGRFSFTDVEVGQTYVLTVTAKKFVIANPTRIVSVNEELTNLDFIANDQ